MRRLFSLTKPICLTVLLFLFSELGFGCSTVILPMNVRRNLDVVVKHAGDPVPSVELSVINKATGAVMQRVTTDAEGHAEVHDLRKGEYTITSPIFDSYIRSTGEDGTTNLPIEALVDRNPITLQSLDGTIFDPSGATVAGAIVVLEKPSPLHTPVATATSDSAGRVKLTARPDLYVMRVAAPGLDTAVVPVRLARDGWPAFNLKVNVAVCGDDGHYTIEPK